MALVRLVSKLDNELAQTHLMERRLPDTRLPHPLTDEGTDGADHDGDDADNRGADNTGGEDGDATGGGAGELDAAAQVGGFLPWAASVAASRGVARRAHRSSGTLMRCRLQERLPGD